MRYLNTCCILLFLVTMAGCASFHPKPEFAFNGITRNHWIIDRKPQYGDGNRDGCIVMSEMKVRLSQITPGNYNGLISDVEEVDSLFSVTLIVNPGTTLEQEFKSDLRGRFSFQYPQKINQIAFDGFGFRKMLVNLR